VLVALAGLFNTSSAFASSQRHALTAHVSEDGFMRPTGRQRLVAFGALLIYLASLPVLGVLWVTIAYRRFPHLGFRDQLYQVGPLSTTILGSLLVVAMLIVAVTIIAIVLYPKAARIPWIGLILNVTIWVASVATMVEPAPILGG
jgi:hypothetical protein